jgi:hypothetical protein
VGVHWRGGERSGVDEGATREADIETYRREKARNRAICSKSCQPHIRSSTWLAKHDLPIRKSVRVVLSLRIPTELQVE